MSLSDDQLRRLLDGEIDAGELADDRVMASIADRVFGVKVDPAVRPVKPRDADAIGQSPIAPGLNEPEMLVEKNQHHTFYHPLFFLIPILIENTLNKLCHSCSSLDHDAID